MGDGRKQSRGLGSQGGCETGGQGLGEPTGPEAGWAESTESCEAGVATPHGGLGVSVSQRRWCQRHEERAGHLERKDYNGHLSIKYKGLYLTFEMEKALPEQEPFQLGGGLRAFGDGGPASQGRRDMVALGQRKVFTLEDTFVHSEPSVRACVCVCTHVRVCV